MILARYEFHFTSFKSNSVLSLHRKTVQEYFWGHFLSQNWRSNQMLVMTRTQKSMFPESGEW